MRYQPLGHTGIDVSIICLGTMTWGEQNTRKEGFDQMDHALENGVNFFDTAEMYPVDVRAETYGHTESIIGDWMSAPKLPNKRNLAIKTAVKMGYYDAPRTCNQNDIADALGIKQGTVAEHLQNAESIIINSWAEQTSNS